MVFSKLILIFASLNLEIMYAVVEIGGQQFKVSKDQEIYVNYFEGEAGKKVSFDRVLLTDNGGKVTVGTPVVSGATVSASIVEQVRSKKVTVFKKKRRKGYRVKNGHRQQMTKIKIEKVG